MTFLCGETTTKALFALDLHIYFRWLCKTEWNIAYKAVFLKNDGADLALGLIIEIY